MIEFETDVFVERRWRLAHGRDLALGARGVLMGVLNVTPDSFSDGGQLTSVELAVERGRAIAADGAAILDIGGESTRPGGDPVDAATEQGRVLPAMRGMLDALPETILSVDTYRADTAAKAVEAGAWLVLLGGFALTLLSWVLGTMTLGAV